MTALNDVYIHPHALCESDQIGAGTRIWAYAHILKGAVIGMHCNIGDHCFVEGGARIGNYVTIKNGNMVWEGVTLEDGVFVGPHVFFTNDLYPRSPRYPLTGQRYQDKGWLLPTLVKHGASLGAGAVIIAGITIGAFALIGSGAVVTRSVPAHALMLGNPAQRVGWVGYSGAPLVFNAGIALDTDGHQFRLINNGEAIEPVTPAAPAAPAAPAPPPTTPE